MSEKVVVFGVQYKSKAEACRKFGIDTVTVHTRMKKGLTLEEALTKPKKSIRSSKSERVVAFGVEYRSIAEACRKFGIDRGTVHARLQKGLTLEEALTAPKKEKIEITINDKHYSNLNIACKEIGVNYNCVYSRLRNGKAPEEAVSSKRKQCKPIIIDGIEYDSITAACLAYNIKRSTVQLRVKYGMSMEDAIKKPVNKKSKKNTE